MSSGFINFITAHYIHLVRSFIVILGCFSIWWGIVGIPVFWREVPAERIANRIIVGDLFKRERLAGQVSILDGIERSTFCRPAALRSAAIIRLRMVEVAKRNSSEYTEEDLKSLSNSIRSSLSCEPADPFLWLILYWVESGQNGFKPEYLKYLRMSYKLGPNEAWIVLKRNPLAFADFERLSGDLATDAIDEFSALIKNELYQQAVEIFSGPAWRIRDAILPHLAALPRRNREAFAKAVYDRGLAVVIPGVERPSSKPYN